ncbi:G-protein coupled receptor 54 [Danaus plexippus]|uniref:G-protein coupled receptor 54 n=1 Tax=Danaus plexippus TaxID=13037 RepID=UPI002AB0CCF7|nr:G-protein coupled receptor 54 [Danaus plexippus]
MLFYEEHVYGIPRFLTNWTIDDLKELDTSLYPFPNTLWHVKSVEEVTLKASFMVLVGVTGIFLNSIILIILLNNKWLWTASNYLVGNLAAVDLITLLFCPWLMLARDFYQQYVLKNFGCKFDGFLQATMLLANVAAIILVCYDRLAAAVLTAEAKITKSVAPKLIFVSWILSIVLSTPWIFKREYVERPWKNYLETYCVEDCDFLCIYWHFLVILLVWIPLTAMTITYGAIIWKLEWGARELLSRGGGRTIILAKRKTMRVTACILLAAAICRIPFTVLVYWRNNLRKEINAVDGGYSIIWFIATYLMYANCAINPVIYGFTNTRFRKAMDRTPCIACFRFGSLCCVYGKEIKENQSPQHNNNEKLFVIEGTPQPRRKLSQIVKNLLHIHRHTVELSIAKVDEATTKPTKVTPLKIEHL